MKLTRSVRVKRYNGPTSVTSEDLVVREVPFTIFVNDEELATLVCTPEGLEELAAGFLCSEGILRQPEDLKKITINTGDGFIWVETTSPVPATDKFLKRYITTCCGKGRASFYFVNDARDLKPLAMGDYNIKVESVTALASLLEERAGLFRSTGGAHGAALFDSGKIIAHYEDIGRHNAVDKILGHCYLNRIPPADKTIVLSGRISSEILIKVARMGLPVIVSRSAPTDLAIEMAESLGVTVAGFARGSRVNIYTHPERVVP
ncbi:MAG: formate dehydrogenase [Peptococcaceae bacterium BICA1-7]|nr:MAG: formate dehydrogenase [Peptococcaceae bacterium BICA1-7]HBV96079.1 formate dehydrogenase accessory sulfurtransferase FdhD [Desulfotomaculum sp.]